MRALELFPCAGGMGEGFRRAGIAFEACFDFDPDACDSYERNLGHRPICIDVRDVLRMARANVALTGHYDLIVADPPCTPWSRAGKRKGLADEADMLAETCELLAVVRPTCWLIGNVPGLDDSNNEGAVDATIGKLARECGYEVDYQKLNASSYGVPQHRVRPFWFGRPKGSSPLRWPEPTHGDPTNLGLPGIGLKPWVTCREALQHLPLEELGRPVRVRWHRDTDHKTATPDAPAPTQTGNTHGDGALLGHPTGMTPSVLDEPAHVVTTRSGNGAASGGLLSNEKVTRRRRKPAEEPLIGGVNEKHPMSTPDAPAYTITTRGPERQGAQGCGILHVGRSRNPDPNSHVDEPAKTLRTKPGDQTSHVMIAAGADGGRNNHPPSTPDEPGRTITASDGGGAQKGHVLTWPWDVPATTVTADERLPPPGHHPETGSVLSVPNAVVLSEKARAILQGFPETWFFAGKTKRSRSAQIGMAMPPPMAHAVATSIVAWFAKLNENCDCGHSAADHGVAPGEASLETEALCVRCSCLRFAPFGTEEDAA